MKPDGTSASREIILLWSYLPRTLLGSNPARSSASSSSASLATSSSPCGLLMLIIFVAPCLAVSRRSLPPTMMIVRASGARSSFGRPAGPVSSATSLGRGLPPLARHRARPLVRPPVPETRPDARAPPPFFGDLAIHSAPWRPDPPKSRWRGAGTAATFLKAVPENEEVVPVNAVSTWVLLSGVTVGR